MLERKNERNSVLVRAKEGTKRVVEFTVERDRLFLGLNDYKNLNKWMPK